MCQFGLGRKSMLNKNFDNYNGFQCSNIRLNSNNYKRPKCEKTFVTGSERLGKSLKQSLNKCTSVLLVKLLKFHFQGSCHNLGTVKISKQCAWHSVFYTVYKRNTFSVSYFCHCFQTVGVF